MYRRHFFLGHSSYLTGNSLISASTSSCEALRLSDYNPPKNVDNFSKSILNTKCHKNSSGGIWASFVRTGGRTYVKSVVVTVCNCSTNVANAYRGHKPDLLIDQFFNNFKL